MGSAIEHAPSAQVGGLAGTHGQFAGDSQVEGAIAVLQEVRAAIQRDTGSCYEEPHKIQHIRRSVPRAKQASVSLSACILACKGTTLQQT